MAPMHLLQEIAIVAAVSVTVTLVLGRLRLPTVAGLLFSGALVGPHALKLASDVEAIEFIAEVGVIFLLFTIGLEFSLSRLKNIFGQVAIGGFLQVAITAGVATGVAYWLGCAVHEAVFYGFVFALSSTALVLRTLSERNELDAPHGRFIVGTLIFQDLCIIPMVLMIPLLAPGADAQSTWAALGMALLKATLMVVGLLGVARLFVPRLLGLVDANRSREVFILAVISICIGTAWLTSLAGVSLALGAFLGGMVVADTQYSHRAMGDILPLRDVFVSFFFVSLGMFFDVSVVLDNPQEVTLLLLAFLFGKGAIATLAAILMRFPPRAAWLAGVGLAQFGEFGFVLIQLATVENVVDQATIAPLLNAGIISMFLTPLLVHQAPHITAGERVLDPLAKLLRARSAEELESSTDTLSGHVVVIGYGLAGQMLAGSLSRLQIEHVILELNAENVALGRERGDPVFYADATSSEALGHAHVESACAVVVMINDRKATERVVATLKRLVPDVFVLVRTEYLGQADAFRELGATDVVASEVEGGLEILSRVMRRLDVPRNVIESHVQAARSDTQLSDRRVALQDQPLLPSHGDSEVLMESVMVVAGSEVVGQSPRSLNLAQKTGALVVAMRRDQDFIMDGLADVELKVDDVVYCIGSHTALGRIVDFIGYEADSITSAS